MYLPIVCFLALFSFASFSVAQTVKSAGLTIGTTSINQNQFKKDWGLEDEEYEKYQSYMSTTGKFFYSHLDPLMVLGMIETNQENRKRFAERYWMKAQKRIEQELLFTEEIGKAQQRLFGKQKLFDFSKLPGYSANEHSNSNPGNYERIKKTVEKTTLEEYSWNDDQDIISIDYLIKVNQCCRELKDILRKTPNTVILNLYAKDLDLIEKTIKKIKKDIHPSRVVAPKRFDPIIWQSNKAPIIRRNGVEDGRL